MSPLARNMLAIFGGGAALAVFMACALHGIRADEAHRLRNIETIAMMEARR